MTKRSRAVRRRRGLLLAALLAGTSPAWGMQSASRAYNLPAQPLANALTDIARQAGVELVAPADLMEGRRAPALEGRYSPGEAIASLLKGTGLVAERVDGAFVIRRPDAKVVREPALSDVIVVTGTRIRGGAPVGAPILTLDREAIEASGYATVHQILRSIPQNFGGGPAEGVTGISVRGNAGFNTGYGTGINLRGLGSSSTLVLLNGHRPPLGGFSGTFADLSLIPVTAIERIEVLTDGASALYGSDAVAGVVNVIPRTRFEGVEISLRAGTADGDVGEVQAGGIAGTDWSSGHLVLSYEYYQRGRLPASERDFATADLRAFGAPDYRLPYASPGTIIAGGRSFAIPAGQDGVDLSPEELLPDQVNVSDPWLAADILPQQERHGFYGRVEQDLGPGTTIYAETLLADRRFENRSTPTSLGPRTVPVTNPFYVDPIGTGQPVQVQYDFRRDLGPETMKGQVQAIGASAGASIRSDRWAFELHATYGHQKERSTLLNLVNAARLALALADTDPETAYNLFGDGPTTNPATIENIRGSTSVAYRYRLWSVAGKADGPLFSLPAGDLKAAFGAEYREESFRLRSRSDRSTLEPAEIANSLPGPRRIAAGFGELLIPIVSDVNRSPLVEELLVSLAGRIEHYSDFGTTTNPKLGISWTPFDGARLRASYGTSFRAPAFADLRQGPENALYFAIALPDPTSPGGTTNALVLRGNDPDIGPERATIWTAGADFEPGFAPGLRLSMTWFDVRYKNRITNPSSELFNMFGNQDVFAPLINFAPTFAEIAALYADPAFQNVYNIAASEVTAIIDARNQNLAEVVQSGLDFDLAYQGVALGGDYEIGASGTWIARLRQAITPTAPAANIVDTLGNPVDLKLRGRATWSKGGLGIAAFVNYVDGYTNLTPAVPQLVRSWTTVDLQLSYSLPTPDSGGGMKLALNISSLFDEDPPFVDNFNGLAAIGYDPEQASPLGRMIAVQVSRTW